MSHNVYTYIAKACAHIVDVGYGDLLDWHEVVTNREVAVEESDNPPGEMFNIENSGWIVTKDPGSEAWESKDFGKYKDVYATVIRKGDAEVYVNNSSQYSHVGEFRITAFADSEETLIDFLADLAPHAIAHIDSPGVVECWC
jgi:hypothetical protein